MASLHLLIPPAALRDAVMEQLERAAFGTIQPGPALPDAPPDAMTMILVDEAAMDAKTIKKLRAIKNEACLVFLLGAPPADMEDNLTTEVFPKPLRLGHLLGRLHFYRDVAPKLRSAPVMIGAYKLDAQQRSMTKGEELIRLTEKETALLEYLAQSEAPVGREALLADVWGYDARIDTHTLETHIYQLRRKLGADCIVNEGGLYRLAG